MNDPIEMDAGSDLPADLQQRLLLSQNSQKAKDLTIEEELDFYEKELGSRFLACKFS